MTTKTMMKYLLLAVSSIFFSTPSIAENHADKAATDSAGNLQVTELRYIEREPGVDDFETVMRVSDRYIRIDDLSDDSGYIVFDDVDKKIYSVSHFDKSVLVIESFKFSENESPAQQELEFLELSDAPTVSGNKVYNYRVFTDTDQNEVTCTEIQLVENLMPEIRAIMKSYLNVVSGQQVRMTDNKITDVQTACYYIDQIYNTGAYYDKGFPIQEWHSNDRYKVLTSYEEVFMPEDWFNVPEDYRHFSIDKNTKGILPNR